MCGLKPIDQRLLTPVKKTKMVLRFGAWALVEVSVWFVLIGNGGADHWWKRMKRREAFIYSTMMEGAEVNKKGLRKVFGDFLCALV